MLNLRFDTSPPTTYLSLYLAIIFFVNASNNADYLCHISQQYITMEQKSQLQIRKQRIAGIKFTLKDMPILKETTHKIEAKIEKRKIRRQSSQYSQNQVAIGRMESESDYQSEKYPSFFKDKYDVGQKIGEGAHGIVKKCYCKQRKQLYAVKMLRLDREHILFLKNNFMDIKQLRHPNIIDYKMLFFEIKAQTCYLVMDYLPHPNLLQSNVRSEKLLREIVYQLLQALKYIHGRKICHRDIKPENILYNQENSNVTLIDFGISKKCVERGRIREMLTVTGTPFYRAPEMFEGGGYDEMVDMWALGITMFQLMTGRTPFESEYPSQTIANIMRAEFTFPAEAAEKYSRSARNLVTRLLKRRNQRLTAEEAMKDMWFIDLHKGEEEFTKSLTFGMRNNMNNLFKNSLVINNSLGNKLKNEGDQMDLRSMKEPVLSQSQSLIYGCEDESPIKRPISSKQILTQQI